MVSEATGAKVSYVVEAKPEPEPEEKGWGIVGDFSEWGNDVFMTESEGVWTAFFTNTAKEDGSTGAFKFRKNASWDENLGATGDVEPFDVPLGEAVALTAGGKNLTAPAGTLKAVLNLTDADAPVVTITSADVYSLIGKINGSDWDTDFELTGADGVYTSDVVYIDGGFKIRHNFSWDDANTYGADSEDFVPETGKAFTAVQPGKDIKLPGGNYRVKFTLATMEVLITSVDYEIPEIDLSQYDVIEGMAGAETWGLIGPAQPGGWDSDTDLQKIQDEPEIWAIMNIALQGDKFKFRGNDTWGDYDLGGGSEFALKTPIVMTKGGGDMKATLGVYTIYLYPTYGLLYITEGSGDIPTPPAKPEAWSLIGTVNNTSWDTDFDLTNTSGDKWEIKNVAIAEADEFKLRANHEWNTSVGGPEENAQSTINPEDPYGVYQPVLGEAFAAGDKNIRIGVAGNYNIFFDYAAQTITIEEYKEFPDALYMIGEEFGGWNWGSDGVVEMTPVLHNPAWGAEAEGQFYTVRYFSANKGFKFCAKRAWDGDFWGLTTNDGFTESGGNCTVAEDGFYLVHIDFKASKVHVEPARVYGIGDAFGGWNEGMEDALFAADGKTLKATVKAGGSLRMYVASTIATSSWWTREFNIIDGKITPRLMDELSAPTVSANQVVTLDFNAGTGSIAGEVVKPEVWSLIGVLDGSSWDRDFDLTNTEGDIWKIENVAVTASDEFKIRADHAWGVSLGGPEANSQSTIDPGNVYDVYKPVIGTAFAVGDLNIQIGVAGNYNVTLDYAAQTILIEAASSPATGIVIDGNYDDWADIPGAEPANVYKAFKVWNDADNFYFYIETDPGSRLWSGGGYLYLYFDWDNDHTTGAYSGATGMGSNKYEAYTYMFIFENNQISKPTSDSVAKGLKLDNLQIAGSDSTAEVVKMEMSIPRADFEQQVNAGDVIGVDSYRSKDGGNIYFPGYVVK